jgi:hypothetical protein
MILDGETPRSLFFRGPGGEIHGIGSQVDLENSWKLFVYDEQHELSLNIDEKIFLNKKDSTQSQESTMVPPSEAHKQGAKFIFQLKGFLSLAQPKFFQ